MKRNCHQIELRLLSGDLFVPKNKTLIQSSQVHLQKESFLDFLLKNTCAPKEIFITRKHVALRVIWKNY